MTLRRSPPRLRLVLKPSFALTALLASAHAGAAVALAVALPDSWLALLAAVILALHGGWVVQLHGLRLAKRSVVWVELHEEDRCIVGRRSGAVDSCRIGIDTYVTPALIVLHLVPQLRGRTIFVVLLPDSCAPRTLRRLRGRLRLMKPAAGDGTAQDASL